MKDNTSWNTHALLLGPEVQTLVRNYLAVSIKAEQKHVHDSELPTVITKILAQE